MITKIAIGLVGTSYWSELMLLPALQSHPQAVENRAAGPTFHDGYKAQQVIDAALESHRSGRAQIIA